MQQYLISNDNLGLEHSNSPCYVYIITYTLYVNHLRLTDDN